MTEASNRVHQCGNFRTGECGTTYIGCCRVFVTLICYPGKSTHDHRSSGPVARDTTTWNVEGAENMTSHE